MLSLPRFRAIALLDLKVTSVYQLKQIHAQLIVSGLNSPSLVAKLIRQYFISSNPHSNSRDAYLVFKHFDKPNVFLFNTLLRCSPPKEAILVFSNWVSGGGLEFDDFTYIYILGACARSPSVPTIWAGRQIHARITKHGIMSNIMVQTTLIHFYASNKDVGSARRVFDEMTVRNSITWNALIAGYCSQKGTAGVGLVLFRDMLVDVCGTGAKPTDTTIVCILSATSQLGVLETGACVHGYIQKSICVPEHDVFIGTGLVDMYSKCGCLESALSVFTRMKEKNILTWTAMATGLAIHGKGEEALELVDAMGAYGMKPNAVTFTSLLLACCHAGLVEEGLRLFHSMSKFNVVPQMQHYSCIVDLLSRTGLLKDAYEFIKRMPVEPDDILWRSLLSASRIHRNAAMGEKVGKLLLQRRPPERSSLDATSEDYVALSNIYAFAGKWENVEMVREEMKVKGIENKAGYSSVQTFIM